MKATATLAPPGWYAQGGKRLMDLAVVIPVLTLAAPVLLLAILLLRLTLGPGVVLTQERIGRHAIPFRMYKLRTMEQSRRTSAADDWDGADRRCVHKTPSDPRHTAIGRILRKFSVDELPQLINVVQGDMSIVGPRPQLASLASEDFRAHPRHTVRPGITGPFQVSPLRTNGELEAGLDLDTTYVQGVSLRSDLGFLVGTAIALIRGTGS